MVCIFCKTTAGPFLSREHVAPESLGNTKFILPPGIVCDRCNNGPLALLDDHLIRQEYINFARTWFKVPNKTGAIPQTRLRNMNILHTDTGVRIELPNHSPKHVIQMPPDENGEIHFKLNMRGRKQTAKESRKLARALYKIALEFIAYDFGAEEALKEKYDEIRNIVLNKTSDFSGYILTTGGKPEPICHFRHQEIEFPEYGSLRIFQFSIYGQRFVFDIHRRKVDNAALLKENGISVLEW